MWNHTNIPHSLCHFLQVLHHESKRDQYLTVATEQSYWAVRRSKDEVDAENDVRLGPAQGACPKSDKISCGAHSGLCSSSTNGFQLINKEVYRLRYAPSYDNYCISPLVFPNNVTNFGQIISFCYPHIHWQNLTFVFIQCAAEQKGLK